MSNSIEIEERVNLLIEVRQIIEYRGNTYLPRELLVSNIVQIDKLSLANLKGILFQYYSNKGDIITCNKVNKQLIDYLAKVNKCISEERNEIQKKQLKFIE